MGTNYYWYPEPACKCCGREFAEIHIGKSSGGWCFSLHVIPEDDINTLDDWKKLWEQENSFIKDEYGEEVGKNQMTAIITERTWEPSSKINQQWYYENRAELGPNGLARPIVDGVHCIGHGEGTWDYIIGEFS